MATEMNRQNEGGSGSAENKGEERQSQKAPLTTLTEEQRNDIAHQTGLKPGDIADVQQTGALSGRDDASGGSGDEMTTTSSDEKTDRF
jgi:hypothetical protein